MECGRGALRLGVLFLAVSGLALALAQAGAAAAQAKSGGPVDTVTVVGTTPLPGTRIDISKTPYDVLTLSGTDLEFAGLPSASDPLSSHVGGVNIDDNLDDPFQPDVLYRGFEASPVLGTPQGLAVYQDGVRINEPFGDTVNWDLIPADAIGRMDVVGTNPVYGLNALGGAVVVTMKNGFDDPGGELEGSGGSFGRRSLALTLGQHGDRLGVFVAARGLDQDGWRMASADSVRQLYADLSARTDRLTLDLSYTGDHNSLHGESPTPVQELAVGRDLIFTSPQANIDTLNFVTLGGSYQASSTLSFQGVAYVRDFRQSVANGNTTDYTACTDPAALGLLCQPDGTTPLASTSGGPIPDISAGGSLPIGQDDRERLHTLSFGGTVQATTSARLLGLGNQLSVGASGDRSHIDYASEVELGVIDRRLVVLPSPYVVSTPEGLPFQATPVDAHARNTDVGAFFTDTLDLTDRLSVTASGRYNWVQISVTDLRGMSLNGSNAYGRFNPAIGATYRLAQGLTAYLGYAEGSRAPTASEIECSDPTSPCLLPSSLSADPPNLRQVVSHTVEAGLRGSHALWRGRLSFSAGLYRTEVKDDIYGVATSLSSGYFQNISGTRRQGGELDLRYRDERLTAYASYAHVDATFQAYLTIPSPSNPFRDPGGDIQVRPGDRLPGIPRERIKAGLEYRLWRGLSVGGDLQFLSRQYYRGDESNQLRPLPGYVVIGLDAEYQVTRGLQLFARIDNLLDARYATFGLLGDPAGVGAPGVPAVGVDNRFQSPAAPFSVSGGVRLRF